MIESIPLRRGKQKILPVRNEGNGHIILETDVGSRLESAAIDPLQFSPEVDLRSIQLSNAEPGKGNLGGGGIQYRYESGVATRIRQTLLSIEVIALGLLIPH